MELNRDDIIKALECCHLSAKDCLTCPYENDNNGCVYLEISALALIKELTEENERLRKLNEEGAECPHCHGLGKIGTTNWLTKHISKEQIAKEKAEAIDEFHRNLKADTLQMMKDKLVQYIGTYTDKSFVYVHAWFKLIDQIAEEIIADGKQ